MRRGRHSQFSCPAECPHNPLSAENYDQFGDIEGRVIRKTIDFFLRENRGNTALLAAYDAAMDCGIGESTAFCLWHSFWLRDADGRTMAERWDARRLDGMGNDERAIFAGHRRVIGRVLLGEKSARIKASSAAANAQLRPETMPVLLAFIAAASDEIDCAVIEAR